VLHMMMTDNTVRAATWRALRWSRQANASADARGYNGEEASAHATRPGATAVPACGPPPEYGVLLSSKAVDYSLFCADRLEPHGASAKGAPVLEPLRDLPCPCCWRVPSAALLGTYVVHAGHGPWGWKLRWAGSGCVGWVTSLKNR